MISLGWAGCSNLAHSTTLTESQTIANKTVSALSDVKSFNLDTDVKNYFGTSSPGIEWKGSKTIDVSNQKMAMNMTITDQEPGNNLELFSLGMYLGDGEDYQEDAAPGLSQPNPWTKTELTTNLWNSEIQIQYLSELLKTAAQINSLKNETIYGIDCYVLAITPSAQGAVDLVVSQEQPFGPQINVDFSGGTPVVRPDAFKSGSIQLWIEQDNYLPVKVEINVDFQGTTGGGPGSAGTVFSTPIGNQENSSFQGELEFSNYNQPASIQLPQGALNAQSVGN
jgi:hypothetical protein